MDISQLGLEELSRQDQGRILGGAKDKKVIVIGSKVPEPPPATCPADRWVYDAR